VRVAWGAAAVAVALMRIREIASVRIGGDHTINAMCTSKRRGWIAALVFAMSGRGLLRTGRGRPHHL
jgi:hypothetical protein